MKRLPLTEFPAEDAPIAEWCRPLSATMVNHRAVTGASSILPGERTAGKTHFHNKVIARMSKKFWAKHSA